MSDTQQPNNQQRQWFVYAIVLGFVAMIGGLLTFNGTFSDSRSDSRATPPILEAGTLIPPGKPLPDFTLSDHTGQDFTPAHLKGRWTYLFFGYTHCPDVCPGTLAMLARLVETAKSAGVAPVPNVVFISVDPKRDTIEQLSRYVPYFNPNFLGVTGSSEAIAQTVPAMGIPYLVRDDGGENYLVDHSGALLLINPEARIQAIFSAPHEVDTLLADYRKLLAWKPLEN